MREPGFYWVRFDEDWTVGEYTPKYEDGEDCSRPWEVVASDECFEECVFAEIDERRIVR